MSQLGHGMGRQRGNNQHISRFAELDMTDMVVLVPHIVKNRPASYRPKRERVDKPGGGHGHNNVHKRPGLGQFGCQINCLVTGNRSRDTKDNSFVIQDSYRHYLKFKPIGRIYKPASQMTGIIGCDS